MIHIMPWNEGHRLDTTCDCGPEVKFLEQILVVHNARGPDDEGWCAIEGDDNYPTRIMEDGVLVPVEIGECDT